MATPVSPASSSEDTVGISQRQLRQLWEKLSDPSITQLVYNESPPQSPTSTRSSSSLRGQSANAWVGGDDVAQDARRKLRAADEARWLQAAASAMDGDSGLSTPTLRMNSSKSDTESAVKNEQAQQHTAGVNIAPDPVGNPYDYMQYILGGSPLSTALGLSPAVHQQTSVTSMPQPIPTSDGVPASLSNFMVNNEVFLDNSFLPLPETEDRASPVEALAAPSTIFSVEALRANCDGATHAGVNAWDSRIEALTQKRRAATLPSIGRNRDPTLQVDTPYECTGLGGYDRCLVRTENFVELAPAPQKTLQMSTNDALPELSSFRPVETDSELRARPNRSSLSRALTAPTDLARPLVPDEPAWMRPMHLIDTGSGSIYLHAHEDVSSRHALCLWCFRTHGDFHKMRRYGYESCGRTELLESHYWEDDTWSEGSSEGFSVQSTSSDC